MRWPRRQVVKPTSASRRSVPSTTAVETDTDQSSHRSTGSCRRARHASQEASKLVVSGPTQTCWRGGHSALSGLSRQLQLARVAAREARGAVDAADDELVPGGAVDEADVGLRRQPAAHARGADGGEERPAFAARDVEAVLAQAREVGRARRDPDAVRSLLAALLKASPPVWSARQDGLLERGRGGAGQLPRWGEGRGRGVVPACGRLSTVGGGDDGGGITRPASSRSAAPAAHAAALWSCCGARSANFAKRLRNASFSVPIGPFLCFARITSARP